MCFNSDKYMMPKCERVTFENDLKNEGITCWCLTSSLKNMSIAQYRVPSKWSK